jgi:hypothetical protein
MNNVVYIATIFYFEGNKYLKLSAELHIPKLSDEKSRNYRSNFGRLTNFHAFKFINILSTNCCLAIFKISLKIEALNVI